ncbi:f-box family protein [Corchorus olitorius]|uniref:F-box family protein n=1 Tax=Corchorus olitorius TaxID=93759 RepID=A0A1R3HIT8_9ROSI|nr:f-box family protein [Corchorus olitorius]
MDRSFIHRVLRYAASHGVQEVTLKHHFNGLHIAHFLCSCKSLRTLELQTCKLSESNFFDPLSKCVNLENLKLIACDVECGQTIKLSAPRLVNLTMAGVKNPLPGQKNQVVLSAPRLSSFCYYGGYPLALSMHGCPILARMAIWLDAPSNKTQDKVEAYYSDTKNLLQEVCCYAKVIQIRLDSWEVLGGKFIKMDKFSPMDREKAISMICDTFVGGQIYNKITKGPKEFLVWNFQRKLLIQTDTIDARRLLTGLDEAVYFGISFYIFTYKYLVD